MCDCPLAELYAKAAKERDEANQAVNKMIARCESLEGQITRLRAQKEALLNRIAQKELEK